MTGKEDGKGIEKKNWRKSIEKWEGKLTWGIMRVILQIEQRKDKGARTFKGKNGLLSNKRKEAFA